MFCCWWLLNDRCAKCPAESPLYARYIIFHSYLEHIMNFYVTAYYRFEMPVITTNNVKYDFWNVDQIAGLWHICENDVYNN